jgi:hypothetical protein
MNLEPIFQAIEDQRAANNKVFMRVWRRVFALDPIFAREAQAELRRGDLRISELNQQLIDRAV